MQSEESEPALQGICFSVRFVKKEIKKKFNEFVVKVSIITRIFSSYSSIKRHAIFSLLYIYIYNVKQKENLCIHQFSPSIFM